MEEQVQTLEKVEPQETKEPIMETEPKPRKTEEPDISDSMESKLTTMAWGLYFVWLGLAFYGSLGVGATLVGIGVIAIGMQIARMSQKLKMEVFWLIIGGLFVLGGFWDMANPLHPQVPVLLLITGLLLLLSTVWSWKKTV